ncbi:MAG: hypothetical protein HYZ91_00680 [Candidatus Omnitrophica bacterium]|nr:hypothetical protein [Candidatus Omnitrophota bacterium]
MTLAIIDVGTNSIHLVIGALGRRGRLRVHRHWHELARLGEAGLADGRLTRAAMRRAMGVLQRYAALVMRSRADHVEAVATSAVREARNGRAFVARVRSRLGLPLRVISGLEEARLIARGVLQTRFRVGATLIVTIGGGSAQVIHADREHVRYRASAPLGSARLAQRFIRHDPPRPDELKRLAQQVRRVWAPAVRSARRIRWRWVLGSSAMIEQLMRAAASASHRNPSRNSHRLSLTQPSLRRLLQRLATSTAAMRRRLPGLDPKRENLALPTAMVLLIWMEGCGIQRIRFASGSLREGLAAEWWHRCRAAQPSRSAGLSREHVRGLARSTRKRANPPTGTRHVVNAFCDSALLCASAVSCQTNARPGSVDA